MSKFGKLTVISALLGAGIVLSGGASQAFEFKDVRCRVIQINPDMNDRIQIAIRLRDVAAGLDTMRIDLQSNLNGQTFGTDITLGTVTTGGDFQIALDSDPANQLDNNAKENNFVIGGFPVDFAHIGNTVAATVRAGSGTEISGAFNCNKK